MLENKFIESYDKIVTLPTDIDESIFPIDPEDSEDESPELPIGGKVKMFISPSEEGRTRIL